MVLFKFSDGRFNLSTIILENRHKHFCKIVYRATTTLFQGFHGFSNGILNALSISNTIRDKNWSIDIIMTVNLHPYLWSHSRMKTEKEIDQGSNPWSDPYRLVHEIPITPHFPGCCHGRSDYWRAGYRPCLILGFGLFSVWYFVRPYPPCSSSFHRPFTTIH